MSVKSSEFRKESGKQVNLVKFLRIEYFFIFHFNLDFYRVKFSSDSLGPL